MRMPAGPDRSRGASPSFGRRVDIFILRIQNDSYRGAFLHLPRSRVSRELLVNVDARLFDERLSRLESIDRPNHPPKAIGALTKGELDWNRSETRAFNCPMPKHYIIPFDISLLKSTHQIRNKTNNPTHFHRLVFLPNIPRKSNKYKRR